MFYEDNRHFFLSSKGLQPGPTMLAGVRQGCPLSGIIFAMCIDNLLKRLKRLTNSHEMIRAYADDIAMVVMDYPRSLSTIARIFEDFGKISGLKLNIAKTVFIPL